MLGCKLGANKMSSRRPWSPAGAILKASRERLRERTEQTIASQLIQVAKERGLSSADAIELKLDSETLELGVDPARALKLANDALGFIADVP